jgi:uncharacterized protein (DUF952 family)
MEEELFRLALAAELPEDAWKTRLQWISAYEGVKGLDDKFIHLSTAEQVVGTAAAYFAGKTDVVLLRFSKETMEEEADLKIRWEDAAPAEGVAKRDGAFPHAYGGPIPYACLSAPPAILAVGPDGKHVFPPLDPAAVPSDSVLSGLGGNSNGVERGMADEDGYDGGAARGMWG